MTISRFEPPPHRLLDAFLDSRQNWHMDEIQTLTGYGESEYIELRSRVGAEGYAISNEDASMLIQAANTLRGLPTTSHEACEEFLGPEWRASIDRSLGDELH